MCGRYTLVRLAELPGLFPWIKTPPTDLPPRYNIAPTQPLLAVTNDQPDQYGFLSWGLVPRWAKDPSIGNRMINARAETLAEKGAFKYAYQHRRCLVPADGFYEWKKSADGKSKQPMYVRMKDGKPFAFAGLWESWHAPDGSELRSCTLVTTAPNKLMSTMHDRMPVILPPALQQQWLDRKPQSPQELAPLLKPYPDGELEAAPVSKLVNSPKNDTPDCIAPPDEEPSLF
jgi:putative SOS response-associated peptidase YedK